MLTRASIRQTLSPANAQALEADLRARESQLELALSTFFEGNAPPKALLKQLVAVTLPLRLTLMPTLERIGAKHERVDAFGAKQSTPGLTRSQSIAVVTACLNAAWPEFDWTPLQRLVAHVTLAVGTAEKTTSTDHTRVINLKAAETWGEGLKLVEREADRVRHQQHGEREPAPAGICGASFEAWILSAEAQFHVALQMVRAVLPEQAAHAPGGGAHTPGGGGATPGAKRPGQINDHLADWQSAFPGVCAFNFLNHRGCQKGDACPHAASHALPIPDQSKLDKFKSDFGFK